MSLVPKHTDARRESGFHLSIILDPPLPSQYRTVCLILRLAAIGWQFGSSWLRPVVPSASSRRRWRRTAISFRSINHAWAHSAIITRLSVSSDLTEAPSTNLPRGWPSAASSQRSLGSAPSTTRRRWELFFHPWAFWDSPCWTSSLLLNCLMVMGEQRGQNKAFTLYPDRLDHSSLTPLPG